MGVRIRFEINYLSTEGDDLAVCINIEADELYHVARNSKGSIQGTESGTVQI